MTTRISTNQMFRNSQAHVATAREREVISAEKSSTMKEIVRPSQNPSGWLTAATIKDDLSMRDSIARTASIALHTLSTTEGIMERMQEYVQRSHEIALSGAGDDFMSAAARKSSLAEMEGIFDGAIQSLNSRYANRTLLAGLKTQSPAFDPQGNYVGDNEEFRIEIARGLVVPVNVSGARAVMGDGIEGGVNILDGLRAVIEGFRNDDPILVRSSLETLLKANDQLSLVRSEIAGRQTQIERAFSDHELTAIQNKEAVSKIEEADAIKVFSDLARDQAVLRASMATSQKLLSENPADILFK